MSYFCNLSQYFENFDAGNLVALNGEPDSEYCIRMAIEAKKIGETIYTSLESLGLNPASLTSLTRVYENAKINNVGLDLDFEWLKKHINDNLEKSFLHHLQS
jgi:hypothetical protein